MSQDQKSGNFKEESLMVEQRSISIVSSSNEAFVPHLATLFLSLLTTKQTNTTFHFYVIDDDISLRSKFLLNRTVGEFNARISYVTIDPTDFSGAVESDRIPQTAYYRISIPNLLKENKRAIYMDCDMITLEDIEALWEADLGEQLLGAVEDAGFHDRLEKMGIESETDLYFNSGLMVMDLEKWREEKITEKVLGFIENNPGKLTFHDQDALNAILHDRWLELDPRWNAQTYMMLQEKEHPTIQGQARWDEATKKPAVIHFCGHAKPWNADSNHPFKENYFDIRGKTFFPVKKETKSL